MVWQGRQGRLGKAMFGVARLGQARQARPKRKENTMNTVYKWKIERMFPVDAQTAGDEIDRICRERGGVEPKTLVDESRSAGAPLHNCFEWRDEVAAEKYRTEQARDILGNITVVCETQEKQAVDVRAFVRVQSAYRPISVVLNDEEKMLELLEAALRELRAYREKYKHLVALKPVFDALDTIAV